VSRTKCNTYGKPRRERVGAKKKSFQSARNLVGIDIDNASRKVDLREVILSKIPAEVQAVTT
jgi:hypothetical protein